MYEHWEPKKNPRRKHSPQLLPRAIGHFCFCGIMFFLVFVGQGVFPEKFLYTQEVVKYHLTSERDFQTAFHNLGLALAEDEFSLQDLAVFCESLFGSDTVEVVETPYENAVMVFRPDEAYLSSPLQQDLFTGENPLYSPENSIMVIAQQPSIDTTVDLSEEENSPPEEDIQEDIQEDTLPIGTVISSYEGVEAEGYCYDVLYLGEEESFSPVYAVVTSEFGMRVNPISGIEGIHRGVDLRASEGTELLAWRSGTVLATGESSESGKYVKLDHGDSILSVYAHCSEILVEEGEYVQGGTVFALSGQTGQVTAAHLHFEILWNGLYLNPLHYFNYDGILP